MGGTNYETAFSYYVMFICVGVKIIISSYYYPQTRGKPPAKQHASTKSKKGKGAPAQPSASNLPKIPKKRPASAMSEEDKPAGASEAEVTPAPVLRRGRSGSVRSMSTEPPVEPAAVSKPATSSSSKADKKGSGSSKSKADSKNAAATGGKTDKKSKSAAAAAVESKSEDKKSSKSQQSKDKKDEEVSMLNVLGLSLVLST